MRFPALTIFIAALLFIAMPARADDGMVAEFEEDMRRIEEDITLRCLQQWPGQEVLQLYCEEAQHAAFSMVLYLNMRGEAKFAKVFDACLQADENNDEWGADYRKVILCMEEYFPFIPQN